MPAPQTEQTTDAMSHVRYQSVEGHRIAYREAGEGPPVLLIHGIPTDGRLWREVVPALAADHRVIVPDLLNFGLSEKPLRADVSIASQARILIGLLDALGIRRTHLVAHDIGGGVAQILAVRRSERVRRLVLIDAVAFDSWPISEFEPLREEGAEEGMTLEEFVEMIRSFLPEGVHDPEMAADGRLEWMLEPWSTEEGKHAFFRNVRRLDPEYTRAIAGELEALPHETLVLWGREDPFQDPAYAERLRDTLPRARLVWIDGAGHWVPEEKPEEIAEHVRAFLDADGAGAGDG